MIQEYRTIKYYYSLLESELCIFQLSFGINCTDPFLLSSDIYYEKILSGNHTTVHTKLMQNQDRRICFQMFGDWDDKTNICTNLNWKVCMMVGGDVLEKSAFYELDKCLIK